MGDAPAHHSRGLVMAMVDCGFENRPNTLALRGPTLYARIGFDADFQIESGSHPNLPADEFPVLVDTGAGNNAIDTGFAMALDLPIIEQQRIVGVQGVSETNAFLVQMYIPALRHTIYGRFAGVNLNAGGQRHYALLGRTFLRNFTMVYEGWTGSVRIEG